MTHLVSSGKVAAVVLLASLPALPALGLIKFANAQGDLYVEGRAGVTYDSNVDANAASDGDTSYHGAIKAEYRRKAGLLGVNLEAGYEFGWYTSDENEDFADPRARAELTKDEGRTTGSLTAGVARQSRTESALNIRTLSWHYDAGLHVKYPVIERYHLTGHLGWDRRDFQRNAGLVDLDTHSAGADLYYVLRSDRDLIVGYRYRATDTTRDSEMFDHAVTAGLTGAVLPKLNGTLRAGVQRRRSERVTGRVDVFDSLTASGTVSWTITRRFTLSGTLARDFETLATDINSETTSVNLDAAYAMTAKASFHGGVGGGRIRYLGFEGAGRSDSYFTYNAGATYTFSDRLKVTLTYFYHHNWSTFAFSDYDRHSLSLYLTSRW